MTFSLQDAVQQANAAYFEANPLPVRWGIDCEIPEFLRKDYDRDSEPGDEYGVRDAKA